MSGQYIVIIIILALAAFYVIRRFWKATRGKGFCCNTQEPDDAKEQAMFCGGCAGCQARGISCDQTNGEEKNNCCQ